MTRHNGRIGEVEICPDIVVGDAILDAVLRQGIELFARDRIGDVRHVPRRNVVIGHRLHRRGAPQAPPGELQAFEGLRCRDFMHDVAVDVDQRRTVTQLAYEVRVPDLVVQGFSGHLHVRAVRGRAILTSPSRKLRYHLRVRGVRDPNDRCCWRTMRFNDSWPDLRVAFERLEGGRF